MKETSSGVSLTGWTNELPRPIKLRIVTVEKLHGLTMPISLAPALESVASGCHERTISFT